ncbi:MAG: hypothetical protein RIE84_11325 [Parvibaculum sp.]|uniref:hypothetical protein n=1 Tax=Parvibaculum sp. TaxID=2024848 RepID=UPI0032EC8B82
MFNNKQQSETGRSVFMSSVTGLANVAAVVTTFFATPLAYNFTEDWISGFVARHYGYGFTDAALIGWYVVTALTVFFFARASIGLAITMGGLAIAARLML